MAPQKRMTIRDLGYEPGQIKTGPKNSILDVKGVSVGQVTIGEDGDDGCKGVTIILPRPTNEINVPCYAGRHTLNGNGEVTGSHQISDWGFTNTPLAITNSLSCGIVFHSIWQWTLQQALKHSDTLEQISRNYGTPVVGETADWLLNDVFRSALTQEDVMQAFRNAETQEEVQEGQNGGGAGMTCHMFPGGTGTSSRVVEDGDSGGTYTLGVICQTNYGLKQDFNLGGLPMGRLLEKEMPTDELSWSRDVPAGKMSEGSIVIYLITDAPLLHHQLNRLARHCAIGLAQVGGHGTARTHSGDIIVTLSTANAPNEINHAKQVHGVSAVEANTIRILKNESMDTMFRAASEATEEAILNSIVAGRDGRTGNSGVKVAGLPVERVKELLKKHLVTV